MPLPNLHIADICKLGNKGIKANCLKRSTAIKNPTNFPSIHQLTHTPGSQGVKSARNFFYYSTF